MQPTVVGYGSILTSTVKYKVIDGKTHVHFKFAYKGANHFIECFIAPSITSEWFIKCFESKYFQGKYCVVIGTLADYKYLNHGSKISKHYIVVESIQFLDLKPSGLESIDGGKFYDRNLLDWERFFEYNERFIERRKKEKDEWELNKEK